MTERCMRRDPSYQALSTSQRFWARALQTSVTGSSMKPTRFLFMAGMAALIVAISCGGEVAAGCGDDAKECMQNGKPTCVPKDDPRYGCASNSCLSCGGGGFRHVRLGCDAVSGM